MTRPRRGYAIVEMLLVMTGLAVVLGLCVGLIAALMKLDRVGRAHLAEATTRDRLARDFRQDVRAAARSVPGAVADAPAGRLELARPDGRVVLYEARDGRVVRVEREGDRVVRRESYGLPSRAVPTFSVRDDSGSVFIAMALPRRAVGRAAAPRDDGEFVALRGRDLRLSGREGGGR